MKQCHLLGDGERGMREKEEEKKQEGKREEDEMMGDI